MEILILPSNPYCANLKKLKTLIFKEEIFYWKSIFRQMLKWQRSCSDPNSNAQRTLCLLKSVLGENVSHPPIILSPRPFGFLEFLPLVHHAFLLLICKENCLRICKDVRVLKRKSSTLEHFQNLPARFSFHFISFFIFNSLDMVAPQIQGSGLQGTMLKLVYKINSTNLLTK